MLRSRAFTPGFKFFAALSAFALTAAFVAGLGGELAGGGDVGQALDDKGIINAIVGPITLGWKGGVGDHLAYTFFVALAVVAAILAGITVAFRDADPKSQAELISVESVPLTKAPNGASYLPIGVAAAFGITLVGWATDRVIMLAGIVVLVVLALGWTVRAWAERATGDDDVNTELYERITAPVRVPVLAAAVVAFMAFGLSRLLLSLSEHGAVLAFSVIGIVVFGAIILVATRPQITRGLATAVLVIGALFVLAAGIIGIARGPEEHGEKKHGTSTEEPAQPTGEK